MTDNKMPDFVHVFNTQSASNYIVASVEKVALTTQYTRTDLTVTRATADKLAHLLQQYVFLDDGMDEGTRAEIYAESKEALAEAEKVSGK